MHLKHDKDPNDEVTLFFKPGRIIECNILTDFLLCPQTMPTEQVKLRSEANKKKRPMYFHRITHLGLRNPSGNIQHNPRCVSSQEQPSEEALLD